MKKLVSPVSFKPLIKAQFMGAAPLKLGRSDACILIVPNFGISQIFFGKNLNATTTNKSA